MWFDAEGGLEHGDEWDAKIRRQIRECVLFIPIISANTQSRHEGYFRIEWELAAERAMGIATGVAFILPVVIDDTREPDALVPDRFRKVQWTRLPGGVVSPEVQARFLKLWSHRTGVLSHEEAKVVEADGHPPQQAGPSKIKTYVLPAAAIVMLVAATAWWFAASRKAAQGTAIPPTPAVAPTTEARQLVAKAWEQLNKTQTRAELEAADQLCKRAADLNPTDADVWATWSQADSWFIYHNFDSSAARQEAAREKAAKAMQLAPSSYEARLAQVCYWVRGRGPGGPTLSPTEAEQLLRELLRERPDEPRALYALGLFMWNAGKREEGFRAFAQLAKNPGFAAIAWMEAGFRHFFRAEFEEAEDAADRSVAIQPCWSNLGLKVFLALNWTGDVDVAKAAIDRMPAASKQEDWGIELAYWVYSFRREPQAMLGVLDTLPREWLHANTGDEPKALLTGEARQMANQPDAAQADFRRALDAIEKQRGEQPNDLGLLHLKIRILSDLGDLAGAEKTYKLYCEINGGPNGWAEIYFKPPDSVVAHLEKWAESGAGDGFTAARLRLDPVYDRLRSNPRFQALLARLDADPRFSPHAKPAAAGASSINQVTGSEMPTTAPLSEVQQLVVKAWELLNKPGLARAELEAAEGLCQHAAEVDKNNADVWATWSQVNTWFVHNAFDDTQARREAARDYAARAVQLAPQSFEARLAQASYIVLCRDFLEPPIQAADAERQLRQLLVEKPDEPRALHALEILLRNSKRLDEALALADRLAKNPAFAAIAWYERALVFGYFTNKFGETEAAADRSIAITPFWGNLGFKISALFNWDGNLEAARSELAQMPTTILTEDFGTIIAFHVYYYSREPDEILRVMNANPRDWLKSVVFSGPKQYFTGLAYSMAGRTGAATLEWRRALRSIEKRLEEHPDNTDLLFLKGELLARLGERDEASKAFELYREFVADKGPRTDAAEMDMWMGDLDGAISVIEKIADDRNSRMTAAAMRLNPDFDPLRKNPRFQALIARLEADPLRSPHAKPEAAGSSADGQAPDSKPVQETNK